MLSNETNSNLNSAETKQDDLDLNKMMQDPSNAELIDNPQAQQNKLPGLLKRSIKDFSTWPTGKQALAVGAACGLISAILPLVAVGLGLAISAIPSAIVGLTVFFAVKAVQSGYKGLKWSAEKTVEGAKHLGGKIKDGYEYSADSLKRGASFVSEKTKEKTSNVLTATANKLYRASGNENYSDRIDNELIPDSLQKERIQEVKEDLRAICTDGKNNSTLIKSILSGISSKIEEKVKEKEEVEFTCSADDFVKNLGLITKWKEQKKFIDNLDADGLRNLVTKRLLDKDKFFRDSIFSEHHDEIKEVIKECKEEHTRFNTLERLNKSAKRHKASSMNSLENSLSGSSSTSSISTVSSKTKLLNPNEHREVTEPTSFWSKLLPSLKGGKKPEEATYIRYQDSELDQIQSAEIGNSRFYVAPEKPPRSNSTGSLSTDSTATTSSFASYRRNSDSGFNSPSSSPQHGMFTKENGELKKQSDLKKTGSLDNLIDPPSKVTIENDVDHLASKTNER